MIALPFLFSSGIWAIFREKFEPRHRGERTSCHGHTDPRQKLPRLNTKVGHLLLMLPLNIYGTALLWGLTLGAGIVLYAFIQNRKRIQKLTFELKKNCLLTKISNSVRDWPKKPFLSFQLLQSDSGVLGRPRIWCLSTRSAVARTKLPNWIP